MESYFLSTDASTHLTEWWFFFNLLNYSFDYIFYFVTNTYIIYNAIDVNQNQIFRFVLHTAEQPFVNSFCSCWDLLIWNFKHSSTKINEWCVFMRFILYYNFCISEKKFNPAAETCNAFLLESLKRREWQIAPRKWLRQDGDYITSLFQSLPCLVLIFNQRRRVIHSLPLIMPKAPP